MRAIVRIEPLGHFLVQLLLFLHEAVVNVDRRLDPEHVIDRSTFEEPGRYSEGIRFVLVGGTFVVRDGALQDGEAGQPIRAPIAPQPK